MSLCVPPENKQIFEDIQGRHGLGILKNSVTCTLLRFLVVYWGGYPKSYVQSAVTHPLECTGKSGASLGVGHVRRTYASVDPTSGLSASAGFSHSELCLRDVGILSTLSHHAAIPAPDSRGHRNRQCPVHDASRPSCEAEVGRNVHGSSGQG